MPICFNYIAKVLNIYEKKYKELHLFGININKYENMLSDCLNLFIVNGLFGLLYFKKHCFYLRKYMHKMQ
ncbi:MAG TPA: hypothetical protein DF603_16135 [Chryseobacterium sp.]|nr:hypothetical protein [Chryseobacterium sp.]